MSIWNEASEEIIKQEVEDKLRNKLEDLLKPFIKPNDYLLDKSNRFDYERCIQRIAKELAIYQRLDTRIDCGHSVRDLHSEQYKDSKPYCTICHLHNLISDAEDLNDKWRISVESPINVKSDTDHDPQWAQEAISIAIKQSTSR